MSLLALALLALNVSILSSPNQATLHAQQISINTAKVVTGCTVIDSPGIYVLAQDISGTYPGEYWCIKINASNVVLDGQGHSITVLEEGLNEGIYVYFADNVTIRNTKITGYWHGIFLAFSYYDTITDNILANNDFGIYLYISSYNKITGNVFINDGLYVLGGYGNTVVGNTVNGKPLVYLEGASDVVIDYPVGQVVAVKSKNIVVKGITIENTSVGIQFYETSNSRIENCVLKNNKYGIDFAYSSDNTVTNNTIVDNEYDGIVLYKSSDNTINSNTIAGNNGDGIYIQSSSNDNTLTNNVIAENWHGIDIDESSHNIISSNRIMYNVGTGMYLYGAYKNVIYNNLFNNTHNIDIEESGSNQWNTTLARGVNIVGGNWIGGNYWDSPSGKGFSEICRDVEEPIGVCDAPYIIDGNNIDYYPLSSSVQVSPPTITTQTTAIQPPASATTVTVAVTKTATVFTTVMSTVTEISTSISTTTTTTTYTMTSTYISTTTIAQPTTMTVTSTATITTPITETTILPTTYTVATTYTYTTTEKSTPTVYDYMPWIITCSVLSLIAVALLIALLKK